MTRIAIVDDNPVLSGSLAEKLAFYDEMQVVFIAENGEDALAQLEYLGETLRPHVILMDIEMPVMDGIAATAAIKNKYPEVKILVLTVFDKDENIFKATMAGSSGYFLKDEKIGRIVEGIDELMSGGAPMSGLIATKMLELLRNTNLSTQQTVDPKDFNLTKREVEILEHIAHGNSNKQIAESCFISPTTVKKHIENIYGKLHISSRAEAVKIAMNNKWVS